MFYQAGIFGIYVARSCNGVEDASKGAGDDASAPSVAVKPSGFPPPHHAAVVSSLSQVVTVARDAPTIRRVDVRGATAKPNTHTTFSSMDDLS